MKAGVFLFRIGHESVEFLNIVENMAEHGAAEMGIAAALRLGRF